MRPVGVVKSLEVDLALVETCDGLLRAGRPGGLVRHREVEPDRCLVDPRAVHLMKGLVGREDDLGLESVCGREDPCVVLAAVSRGGSGLRVSACLARSSGIAVLLGVGRRRGLQEDVFESIESFVDSSVFFPALLVDFREASVHVGSKIRNSSVRRTCACCDGSDDSSPDADYGQPVGVLHWVQFTPLDVVVLRVSGWAWPIRRGASVSC